METAPGICKQLSGHTLLLLLTLQEALALAPQPSVVTDAQGGGHAKAEKESTEEDVRQPVLRAMEASLVEIVEADKQG